MSDETKNPVNTDKIDDTTWKVVCDLLDGLKDIDTRLGKVVDALSLTPDSEFCEICYRAEGQIIDAIVHMVGDTSDTISWFIYEAGYGENGFEAGCTGDMREIKTYDDLRWLLTIDCTEKS